MQPTAAPESPYLSVKQAATLLSVNTKTIHQMIADGLPHLKVGKRVIRIDRRQLEKFCSN